MNLPTAILKRGLLGIALTAPMSLGAQAGTWALTNARIETVSKGVIEKGTIIIRDGMIAAVGADVAVPADARVLDMSRRTISPALIDLTSTIGLPASVAPVAAPGGGRGGATAASAGERIFSGFDPDRMIAREVKVSAADARTSREGGVAAVLVAPSRGAIRGMSALLPMKDSVDGMDAIRSPVAQHFGFSGGGGGFGGGGTNAAGERLPGTIMGVVAYQRQAIYDARRQGMLLDRWKSDPRGLTRPDNDPELEALVPAARGLMPIFYDAPQENDIRRAIKESKEFDLKYTIVGATEGFKAVDALKGQQVIVSVNFPTPATVTGWSYRNAMQHPTPDSAAADREARKSIEANAAVLHKAGLKFALASGGSSSATFVANVKKAIAAGLPADVALEAVTLRAAEMVGMSQALGSIEVGKIANLVVTEGGNVLSDSGRVRAMFVDGRRYEVAAAPAAVAQGGGRGGRGGGPGGPGGPGAGPAMAQMGGSWQLTINSPQGAQAVTLTASQNGAAFTGKVSGLPQMGDTEISNGHIDGNKVSWSLALSFGAQSINLDFNGEVTGTKISGTVALGPMGNATFSGDKSP